jgi:hypothetical protein
MVNNTQMTRLAFPSKRLFAALATISLFSVFFVLPLCTALMLCSMPCCHPDVAGSSVFAVNRSACASECAVRADDRKPAEVNATAAEKGLDRSAPVVIAFVQPTRAAAAMIQHEANDAHRAADAPLHVLNSVFRI